MNTNVFRRAMQSLAARAESAVGALWDAFTAHTINTEEFTQTAGNVVALASSQATVLSDVHVADLVDKPPVGLGVPVDEADTVQHLIASVMQEDPTPQARILRLAGARPQQSALFAQRDALKAQGITRYAWQLSEDPCNLCRFLAKRTWPVSKAPVSHPNCLCTITPVEA